MLAAHKIVEHGDSLVALGELRFKLRDPPVALVQGLGWSSSRSRCHS
jgi:hypothetical protein